MIFDGSAMYNEDRMLSFREWKIYEREVILEGFKEISSFQSISNEDLHAMLDDLPIISASSLLYSTDNAGNALSSKNALFQAELLVDRWNGIWLNIPVAYTDGRMSPSIKGYDDSFNYFYINEMGIYSMVYPLGIKDSNINEISMYLNRYYDPKNIILILTRIIYKICFSTQYLNSKNFSQSVLLAEDVIERVTLFSPCELGDKPKESNIRLGEISNFDFMKYSQGAVTKSLLHNLSKYNYLIGKESINKDKVLGLNVYNYDSNYFYFKYKNEKYNALNYISNMYLRENKLPVVQDDLPENNKQIFYRSLFIELIRTVTKFNAIIKQPIEKKDKTLFINSGDPRYLESFIYGFYPVYAWDNFRKYIKKEHGFSIS